MVVFGSYNTRTVDANVAGSSSDEHKVHYALDVSRDESDAFSATKPSIPFGLYDPNKDAYDKLSVNGQLGMDLAKGHAIGLSFLQSQNKTQFDDGPGYDDHEIENLKNYKVYSRDEFLPGWASLLQLSQSEDKLWTGYATPGSNVFVGLRYRCK